MRTTAAVLAVIGLVALVGLGAPVHAAADDWSLGGIFEVGGVHFRVGWHDGDHHRGLYVRAESTLGGVHRSTFCFRDGDHLYHHPTCPLVRRHFRRHDLRPERVIARHSPPQQRAFVRKSAFVRGRGHPGRGRGKGRGGPFKRRGRVDHGVPPGHLPPPGLCRIWYPGVPPGHQPPPTDCGYAFRYAPYGSFVVSGGY